MTEENRQNPAVLDAFRDALISCDEEAARRILSDFTKQHTPLEFVETVIVPSLDSIGKGWANQDYALSQVYISGRICEELVDSVLAKNTGLRKAGPRMAIVVLNDYHALGKQIVYSILRGAGYDIFDYGRMETGKLVRRVVEDRLELLFISVLMIASAMEVKAVIQQLRSERCSTRVAVGGAPFRLDSQLWKDVGADTGGKSASDALSIVQMATEGRL